MSMSKDKYSDLTIQVTKNISKEEKKQFGIFITPQNIITVLIDKALEFVEKPVEYILEPSCGTAEIVNYCDQKLQNILIDGIELNKTIYNTIKDLKFKNKVTITNANFITYRPEKLYDFIPGNPPYFVCKKTDVPKQFEKYVLGRPNIFGLFILKSIELLKPNGILAFVIPRSFLNSIYYSKIRNYIKDTCIILSVEDYTDKDDFIDTSQATFGLILKKLEISVINPCDCKHSVLIGDNFMFTDNSLVLKKLFEGSTTIDKLGLKVRTGTVVWNEKKDKLSNDDNDTLLLYNTNLTKGNTVELKHFTNEEKKQYIKLPGQINPTLVVNRGNGNSAYKLQYALIKTGPYLIENHLNEIYSPKKMEKNEMLKIYNKIINSFQNPKTQEFIKIFLGNNGLSKTELETIFPIY